MQYLKGHPWFKSKFLTVNLLKKITSEKPKNVNSEIFDGENEFSFFSVTMSDGKNILFLSLHTSSGFFFCQFASVQTIRCEKLFFNQDNGNAS